MRAVIQDGVSEAKRLFDRKFLLYCLGCVLLGLVLIGVRFGLIDGDSDEPDIPPVSIVFRQSAKFWKDKKEYVMIVANEDLRNAVDIVLLRDGQRYPYCLEPGMPPKELGSVQIGKNFISGDSGYVMALGYGYAWKYWLEGDQYYGEVVKVCDIENVIRPKISAEQIKALLNAGYKPNRK